MTRSLYILDPRRQRLGHHSRVYCRSHQSPRRGLARRRPKRIAMLRAKIDLRQPSLLLRPRTVTAATVSSQGLKNTQFPRFGAGINLHTSKGHIMRLIGASRSALQVCTGAPTSLPRELHSSDLPMRPRGVPERAHRRTPPLPRACRVSSGLCCSFIKSTRLRLDPQGYIAGDAGVTQRSAHKRSLQCSAKLCPCETERARDGSVNILSLRTLRVFSDHKQETDSSTKGLVCLPLNQVNDSLSRRKWLESAEARLSNSASLL